MRAGLPVRTLVPALLACYGLCAGLCCLCERALFPRVSAPYGQEVGEEGEAQAAGAARASQKLGQTAESYFAEYHFQNFNRDRLGVRYQVPKASFQSYCSGFWYKKADLDAIDEWHNAARQSVYRMSLETHKTQSQIDMAMKNLQAMRDRKIRDYLASRGFKLLSADTIDADVPGMVRRSVPALKPVALALDRVAEQNSYDSETLVGAATSLVQTALRYQRPENLENGWHTGGILPPAMSLVRGWGDCDTKTGVLASILSNWPQVRIVGIAVPDHYLMAILRLPAKGEAFIEYQGLQYVLVEPAGPAWLPPGTVGVDTMPKLQAAEGFRVEPFGGGGAG